MNDQPAGASLAEVLHVLAVNRKRWLVPAVVGTLLAAFYLLVRTPTWEASQALALRNEAANNTEGPGRFRQAEDMKVTQETLLEIAKSHTVLSAALVEVGPSEGRPMQDYPTPDDLTELRGTISLTPPKGTEFGKTEIVYLTVRGKDRVRTAQLVAAVCQHMQSGLQGLRQKKAQSMIEELAKAADVARSSLQHAVHCVGRIEGDVGADLGELRMLELNGMGDSDLRRKMAQIENELRDTQTGERANQELLEFLRKSQADEGEFLATPNKLLEAQPALRRLKDGLVDAQMRTAQMLGTMTEAHPLVQGARLAQQELSRRLHSELQLAIHGVELDLRLAAGRWELLRQQADDVTGRLHRLAALRAEYSMLAADMRHHTTLVERAEKDLADAHAVQAGATSGSLVCTLDRPEIGNRPLGPDEAIIMLLGGGGGFLIGLGWIVLTIPTGLLAVASATPAIAGVAVARAQQKPLNSRAWQPSAQVLSLNEALLTLAQRETVVRRT